MFTKQQIIDVVRLSEQNENLDLDFLDFILEMAQMKGFTQALEAIQGQNKATLSSFSSKDVETYINQTVHNLREPSNLSLNPELFKEIEITAAKYHVFYSTP